MQSVGTAKYHNAVAVLASEDEDVATRSHARLLISAETQQGVETLAHRVHETGPRAPFPFVQTSGGDLPVDPAVLKEYWTSVLAAAAGGSVLISAVEEMPPAVQNTLMELLAGPELARGTSIGVRLISGTTVSLLDRIVAGTFSEQLFYRLNIIHLAVSDVGVKSRAFESAVEMHRNDGLTVDEGAPQEVVEQYPSAFQY